MIYMGEVTGTLYISNLTVSVGNQNNSTPFTTTRQKLNGKQNKLVCVLSSALGMRLSSRKAQIICTSFAGLGPS